MILRLLLGVAGLGAMAWAYARWRQALTAALVLLVLEGAIRKWVFPGAQDLIYFGKDALLLGCYAGFWGSPARRRLPSLIPRVLVAGFALGAVFGALQIFNPNLPNVFVGLLGFKAYFFYIPLLWVVPAAFADDRQIALFLRRYVWLAIPVGLLAVAQFRSPAASAINTYARSSGPDANITTFGSSSQVRVTGTFSYITGYSSYVLTIAILILAILAAVRWRLRGQWLTYGALGLTLLGMLMSGSRGPVLLLALLLPLYGWLSLAREGGRTLGQFLLGASVVAVLVNYVGSDALGAFYGRAAGSGDIGGRLLSPLVSPLHAFDQGGFFGFGIGATHQTAAAVTRGLVPYSWLRGAIMESESGQVMLELGPLGFALIYFTRFALVFLALRQVFVLKTSFHRAIATSALLFFLAHLPGGVIFNVTAGLYYGFFGGLLALVMRLDRGVGAAAPSPPPAVAAAPPPRVRRAVPAAPSFPWPTPP